MGLVRGKDIKQKAIAQVATPGTLDIELDADIGPQTRVYVIGIVLASPAAGTVKFTSGGADITGAVNVGANGGYTAIGDVDSPVLESTLGNGLALVSAGAGAGANGWIRYYLGP